jgi:hypothetical protein
MGEVISLIVAVQLRSQSYYYNLVPKWKQRKILCGLADVLSRCSSRPRAGPFTEQLSCTCPQSIFLCSHAESDSN